MKGLFRSFRRLKAREGGTQPAAAGAGGQGASLAIQKLTINLVNKPITIAAAGAGVAFGTVPLAALPKGRLLFLAKVVDVVVSTVDTDLITTWNGNWALGSAPDADGSLAGTEVDIVASTALGAATARVSPPTAFINTTAAVLDNRAGTGEVNWNMFALAADFTDAGSAIMLLNGEIILTYCKLDIA